jgi:SAM-dependent methyltransferase
MVDSAAEDRTDGAAPGNRWIARIEEDPDHSNRYVERFRTMAADGVDLHGEARFIDAMVARGARILDAGCGPGRVGGRLAELGHDVVGVDLDPVLIAAAEHDHPGPTWLVGDLAELDLHARGVEAGFDAAVCAGNVMGFLDPTSSQRGDVELRQDPVEPAGQPPVGVAHQRVHRGGHQHAARTTVASTKIAVASPRAESS